MNLRLHPIAAVVLTGSLALAGAASADAPALPSQARLKGGASAPRSKTVASKKAGGKKKRARGPVFSGRLASSKELRTDPLDRPSGHIELYAVNFREGLSVDLYDEDGDFDMDSLDALNHFFRCRRTRTEKAVDPRLFEMLSRVYDHFGKTIELVSGFRNQKRVTSYHFHGSASDIRIPGVSEDVLHRFISSLDLGNMGIGIYPRAGFVHLDMRPTPSYRWVDRSPPGTQDMGRPHHKKKARGKARAPIRLASS